MASIAIHPARGKADAKLIADSFLTGDGLPFASVLPSESIQAVFEKHNALFGMENNAIYNTPIVLWAFLLQQLAGGKLRSCSAAVACVIAYCSRSGITPPSPDTGDYCSGRAKLNANAIRELMELVERNCRTIESDEWLWKGFRAKLVDGFTATMPDTPKNMEKFPHPKTQKQGVGLPIMRACVTLTLATACIVNAEYGPYKGKETGENALFLKMLDSLDKNDVVVFDRYYCSYMMLATLMQRGVHTCVRMHQLRKHESKVVRLGKHDKTIEWERPQRPAWMDDATYATVPKTIRVRVVSYTITRPGMKSKKMTVVTTLLDNKVYTPADIAELYGYRWNVELDIRQIKRNRSRSLTP